MVHRTLSHTTLALVVTLAAATTPRTQSVTDTERAWLNALDSAWSTGESDRVFALFDFVHPQTKHALARYVTGSTANRPCTRKTRVVHGYDLRADAKRRYRAFALETTIEIRGKKTALARYYEILVLHPLAGGAEPRGLLLLRTNPADQRHVAPRGSGMPAAGHPDTGRPIGRDLTSRCPACNYQIGTPAKGNWAIVATPSFRSGCLEGVEIFNLDHDLALQLSIVTDTSATQVSLRKALSTARGELARRLGLDRDSAPWTKLEKPLRGWSTSLRAPGEPGRAYELRGFRSGAATYLLTLQGSVPVFDGHKDLLDGLRGAFSLLDAKQSVSARTVLTAHGGPGRFTQDGKFVLPRYGLAFASPDPTWTAYHQPGASFEAGWRAANGSHFAIVGQYRDELSWSASAVNVQLLRWTRACKRDPTKSAFRVEHKPRKLEGMRPGWSLDFDYDCKVRGHMCGSLIAVPHDKLLVMVRAVVAPGGDQAARRLRLFELACDQLGMRD